MVVKIGLLIIMLELYPFIAAFRYNWDHYGNTMLYTQIIEWFFLVDIIINFFREYTPIAEVYPVRDLRMCAFNYLQTKFLIDFIAILPL
jgi:hypothetical protein